MPSSPNYKRNYKQEYDNYHSSTEQKKNRATRNQARRMAEKANKVHKGDGKDVDHKRPLSKGGSNRKGNRQVLSASENRSFKRNKHGGIR